MKLFGIGMAAVLAMLALAPMDAHAASRKDAAAALFAAKMHDKGKADAPALVAAAGLKCNIADARMIGEDKKGGIAVYEVACKDNMGFVIEAKSDGKSPPVFQNVYSCLHTSAPLPDGSENTMRCQLEANADQTKWLQAYVNKIGRPCDIERARYVGQTQKEVYIEVACARGTGYMMATAWPADPSAPAQLNTCLIYEDQDSLACELTDHAAQLAPVDALVAKSGKECQITNRRHILATKNGDNYYEVACASGTGYVLQEDIKGDLTRAINCAHADFVSGGCTLTDARAGETEQAALYTTLAKRAGFDCNVEKYAALPTTGPKEVIELKCANRADGGIGVFPASGTGHVYDCVRAEVEGYRCAFSEKAAALPHLTADLKAMGKPSCVVSDARAFGRRAADDFIEVACSDGLPGWVIVYPSEGSAPKEVLSCGQAAKFGSGGCRLATNRS